MTYEKDKIHPDRKKKGNYLMFHKSRGKGMVIDLVRQERHKC